MKWKYLRGFAKDNCEKNVRGFFPHEQPLIFCRLLWGQARGAPTARNFFTRPPTGRCFSPALPSDFFAIDFPGRVISPGEGLSILFISR